MCYQMRLGVKGAPSWLEKNKSREEILLQFMCPFVNREVTVWEGVVFDMSSCGHIGVFKTDKPVDSDWPLKKSDYMEEGEDKPKSAYESDLISKLQDVAKDVTLEMYREAIDLVYSGKYRELRAQLGEKAQRKETLFVCAFGNTEVDHNYEYVIKPAAEKHQFRIRRADDISNTQTITETIVSAIKASMFVIADMTEAKPNCYYEVGYAHGIGKPVIVLAKAGTTRYLDLAVHNWTHWNSYEDLKSNLEKRLEGVLAELGLSRASERQEEAPTSTSGHPSLAQLFVSKELS